MMFDQDAKIVNDIANEILAEFARRPELKEETGLRIKRTGEEDRNRLGKFGGYLGPDATTIKEIDGYAAEWTKTPNNFWNKFVATDKPIGMPQAFPVICYLRASACNDV